MTASAPIDPFSGDESSFQWQNAQQTTKAIKALLSNKINTYSLQEIHNYKALI